MAGWEATWASGAGGCAGTSQVRQATTDELAKWDELIASNPDGGNALQTKAWGDFKGRWGWQPRRFVYELSGREVAVQWLVRSVPVQGEIWYAPKGPGVVTESDYLQVVEQSRTSRQRGVYMRFESEGPR